jgi:energy-coupling factor transporter ATP-binding protein EcfA2
VAGDALSERPRAGKVLALVDVAAAPPGLARPLLTQVTLSLGGGEIGALVGGSGSGKSTLLRTAAGLWPPRAGRVAGPSAGGVGLVLDEPDAQFVAASVSGEIEFALEAAGLSGPALTARRDRLLQDFQLESLAARDPRRLSGGEKQRALVAAALAPEPALLLLDDPFLHVGPAGAGRLWAHLRRCLRDGRLDAVLIATGDADQAAEADRLGVLDRGRLLGWGPPAEVAVGPWPPAVEPPLAVWLEARLQGVGWRLGPGGITVEDLSTRLREARPA